MTPERAIRDYLLTRENLREWVGDRIYFISRLPRYAGKTVLTIERVSTLRDYSLNFGEECSAQALIGLDVLSRKDAAISECYKIAEALRINLSGFIGQMGDVYFPIITIETEDYLSTPNQDASDDWIHTYSTNYRAMYSQEQPAVPGYGA